MKRRPISVLHVTRSLASRGGIEEYLRLLGSRLDRSCFRMAICAILDRRQGDILPEFSNSDISIFCGNRRGHPCDLGTTLWIKKAIKKFRADIVHTHTDKGNFHGRLAAVISRVPVVTTHHDMGDMAFAKTPGVKPRFGPPASRLSLNTKPNFIDAIIFPFLNVAFNRFNTKVVCVSGAVKRIYTAKPNDPDVVAVHSPYDETIFQPDFKGLRGEGVTLGVVGRLVTQKGHIYLLEALKKLKNNGRQIFLKVIGTGDLEGELRRFVKENNLARLVTFCGDLPHNASLYDGIDIYVQPSVLEGCSITLLEAMGSGIPVIASDIDGPAELIAHGKTGILVKPEDPAALAAAVECLLADRAKALQIGQAAADMIHRNYASKVFVKKMENLYYEIAAVKR